MKRKNSNIDLLFPAGPPVAGNLLIGREEIIQDILRLLKIGQSCIITAPRRYGKTSVVLEVLKRLKHGGYFTAHIDLFTISSKRMFAERWTSICLSNNPGWAEKTWDRIKKGGFALIEGLRFKPSVADMEFVLQFEIPSADVGTILEKAIDFPEHFAGKHGKTLFFALDEFQSVLDFGDLNLVKVLRAHFQLHRHVVYLFAGSHESLMTQIFKGKRHAFYRFGRTIQLGPISNDAFVPYIVRTFQKQQICVKDDTAGKICEITGGHPYYTQLVCQILYEMASRLEKKDISNSDLSAAVDKLMAHEEGLFSDWWEKLGSKRHAHAALSCIAGGRSPYEMLDITRANANRVVTDLKRMGYIGKRDKDGRRAVFYIRDPFFAEFIRRLLNLFHYPLPDSHFITNN